MTRRRVLGMGVLSLGALGVWHHMWGIAAPPKLDALSLSEAAAALVKKCWEGIDPAKVVDIHTHVLGLGVGGTGCFVHPEATSWSSPVRVVKTRFYKGAAGIYDDTRADSLFMERLVDLCQSQSPRGRWLLMAFDKHHTDKGEPDLNLTEFYTPHEHVLKQVQAHPDLFLMCASVHPYREDALDAVRKWRDKGAVAMKWLPNAMNIDPADPRLDPYYDLLVELGMPLISHAGEEQAVHAEEAQELGNPLRLRRALDRGVKVVVAHCASLGMSKDLDAAPDAKGEHPSIESYALFRRMLDEKKYQGRLFGDLSAMTQFNRCGDPLTDTIASPHIHDRLLNGSDYPLPAIDPLIRTGLLVDEGYIAEEQRTLINEIFAYNPLLFDFVLKRCLRVDREGTTHRLPTSAFETAHLFEA